MVLKHIKTSDKSSTLYSSDFDEHYHSTNGAYSESMHVFIQSGLQFIQLEKIRIFEIGFGTGLNAILSYLESFKKNIEIDYTGIELYPIDPELIDKLNFPDFIPENEQELFKLMHRAEWNKEIKLAPNFTFSKIRADFNTYHLDDCFDLIYFDAFAPETQPEMWSAENFQKLYQALNKDGILVTYSSKGLVKRNLRQAGFKVKRLEGPVGKRHMLRASKEIEF